MGTIGTLVVGLLLGIALIGAGIWYVAPNAGATPQAVCNQELQGNNWTVEKTRLDRDNQKVTITCMKDTTTRNVTVGLGIVTNTEVNA